LQSPASQTGSVSGDHLQSTQGQHGFHVWAFWSSRYTWLPPLSDEDAILRRRLEPHETEIFHVKAVTPDLPQYIGSDLHFSCGKEVQHFATFAAGESADGSRRVDLQLSTSLHRVGHVWVYVPVTQTDHIRVMTESTASAFAGGSLWTVVGNTPRVNSNGSILLVGRILRIRVVVRADGSPDDGRVQILY
jgi:hypothetical protein